MPDGLEWAIRRNSPDEADGDSGARAAGCTPSYKEQHAPRQRSVRPAATTRTKVTATETDILVVAAFPPELETLVASASLGPSMRGRVGAFQVTACAVGIGLPQATAGASIRIGEERPRAVVMVGTCGAYLGAGLGLGEVAVADRIRLVDPSVLGGVAQFPDLMSVTLDTHPGMTAGLVAAGAGASGVATTLAITVDDHAAARIAAATGARVEHLEAHGVATACASRGVAFTAVLGVANFVGANAREQWRAHHRAASRSAIDTVLTWLRAGAAGAPLPLDRSLP